jgi:hypothetical protein
MESDSSVKEEPDHIAKMTFLVVGRILEVGTVKPETNLSNNKPGIISLSKAALRTLIHRNQYNG